MLRLLLIVIVLFALPFAVYVLYRIWSRQGLPPATNFAASPTLVWLTALGCLLALAGMLSFSSRGTLPADGIYVPERYEDGKLIPGHIRPAPEQKEQPR